MMRKTSAAVLMPVSAGTLEAVGDELPIPHGSVAVQATIPPPSCEQLQVALSMGHVAPEAEYAFIFAVAHCMASFTPLLNPV
jgi:hypothetical protein